MQGFSLLEMMVVLIIAGMALTLTSQAVGQYQRVHAQAVASERANREYRLSESWFRAAVRGLVAIPESTFPADTRDADSAIALVFEGRSDGFQGTTLAPVLAGQGLPTSQSWDVVTGPVGTEVFRVRELGRELLLSLPGAGGLRLHYLDAEGGIHDRWPPAQGAWPQLPAAIVLEVAADPGLSPAITLMEAIAGPHIPLELPYEQEPL